MIAPRGLPDARHQCGQPRQNRENSHHRDIGDREEALQALGFHRLAADAEESDIAVRRFAQRADQLEAELVARMFANDESDPQRTRSSAAHHPNP